MSIAIPVKICASDGYLLSATLFCSPTAPSNDRAAVMNAGAGIPAAYYARFADWLADRGIPTLTYDYRGIGGSRPPSLRGFETSVEEWGSKDCAAAVALLASRFPGAAVTVIGHSIGCFLSGFVKNPIDIKYLVFVSPHTGFYGDYLPSVRPSMWFLWHLLMPLVTFSCGYFPGRFFGLPADLPYGVALEWAQRRRPEFWWNLRQGNGELDTKARDELLARFFNFAGDALTIRTTDDPFATEVAALRVQALFRRVRFESRLVDPNLLSMSKVGHFGFFRSNSRRQLWPIIGDWIQARSSHADASSDDLGH